MFRHTVIEGYKLYLGKKGKDVCFNCWNIQFYLKRSLSNLIFVYLVLFI